ncbi:MAG: glutamate racemase [Bacteroides sp.]
MENDPKRASLIGVIDSGVGGLTVLVRLIEVMPSQPFLYLADQAWCPYGGRSEKELQQRLIHLVEYMIREFDCSMIVVACNTATAAGISLLRKRFHIPFVGMEPAIKPAALSSTTKHIGVLATSGTLASALFQHTMRLYEPYAHIHFVAGRGLVELIESGKAESEEVVERLHELLSPLLQKRIDHLVLGCTHYPLLCNTLTTILPKGVKIIDPAPAVARRAREVYRSYCFLGTNVEIRNTLLLQSTASNTRLREFAERVFKQAGVAMPEVEELESYLGY